MLEVVPDQSVHRSCSIERETKEGDIVTALSAGGRTTFISVNEESVEMRVAAWESSVTAAARNRMGIREGDMKGLGEAIQAFIPYGFREH